MNAVHSAQTSDPAATDSDLASAVGSADVVIGEHKKVGGIVLFLGDGHTTPARGLSDEGLPRPNQPDDLAAVSGALGFESLRVGRITTFTSSRFTVMSTRYSGASSGTTTVVNRAEKCVWPISVCECARS